MEVAMGLFGPKLTPEQTQTLNVLQNAMEALYINSKMYFREHKSEFDIDPRFLDPTTYNESDVEKVRVQRRAYKAFINELKNRLHECNKDFLIANHLYTSEGSPLREQRGLDSLQRFQNIDYFLMFHIL